MTQHAHVSRWKTWSVAAFCLVAFAVNSIFCRMALAQEGMDSASFTAVRLLSGALLLAVLVALRSSGGLKRTGSWKGGILLFAYAYSFSVAYVTRWMQVWAPWCCSAQSRSPCSPWRSDRVSGPASPAPPG